ncbi:MAG: sigma-70 family RNA polymerase sigma factor [bacterium]|nr:sigma-70 family RNA polymerase sigma factor [bacterium]
MQASPSPHTRIDDLLVHDEWIRRLARRLVVDPNVAEDLVQRTWLTALTRLPSKASRAWLGRVLRSQAHRRWREESTRADYEARTVAEGVGESPADSAARADVLRKVAEALVGLEEPFRSTLTLRYVEEESSVEIGRRLSISDGTVRWRLRRGLELLRADLDREFEGDRSRWLAGLAPFLPERATRAVAAAAIPIGAIKLVGLVAFFVLTSAGLIALWSRTHGDADTLVVRAEGLDHVSEEERPSSVMATSEQPAARHAEPSSPEPVTESELLEPSTPAAESAGTIVIDAIEGRTFRVRVVGDGDAPVEGARVCIAKADSLEVRATTDANGRADVLIRDGDFDPEGGGYSASRGMVGLRVVADGRTTSALFHLTSETVGRADIDWLTIELQGDERIVRGRVVDERGNPVAAARVAIDRKGGRVQSNQGALVETQAPLVTWTDEEGRYTCRGIRDRDLRVRVLADGFLDAVATRFLREERSADCDVTLRRGTVVSGVVRDADGQPVAGARVWYDPLEFEFASQNEAVPGYDARLGGYTRLATADAGGAYQLEAVPSELVRLWAQDVRRPSHVAWLERSWEARDTGVWDPALTEREPLTVEVRRETGEPFHGSPVVFERARRRDHHWYRRATVGADGNTPAVFDYPDALFDVAVFPPGEEGSPLAKATERTVADGPFAFVVRARPEGARIAGALRDAEGGELGRGMLVAWDGVHNARGSLKIGPNADRVSGTFRGEVPPSTFTFSVIWYGHGVFSLGEHTLEAGSDLFFDEAAPPTSHVVPSGTEEPAASDLAYRLEARLAPGERWDEGIVVAEGEGLPSEPFELLPGVYIYSVLRAGEVVSRVGVPVELGTPARFDVRPGADPLVPVRVVARDGQRRSDASLEVFRAGESGEELVWSDPGGTLAAMPGLWFVPLPKGSYRLVASAPDGAEAAAAVETGAMGSAVTVDLVLE